MLRPVIHIELTGKTLLTILALVASAILALALVWMLAGPAPAIISGVVLILIIRGVVALITPN